MLARNSDTHAPSKRRRAGWIVGIGLAVGAAFLTGMTTAAAFKSSGNACADTAAALNEATLLQARVDAWTQFAKCLNDSEANLNECVDEILKELASTERLAADQLQGRLDLCQVFGPDPYDPDLDPRDFTTNVTNPYFPMIPGRTLVYEKITPEGLERVEVTTLSEIAVVDGFDCRSLHDVVRLNGVLVEDTIDWYAQDQTGSIWYFGEIAKNYEEGLLTDLDGSWRTGRDGAKAGIIMPASPVVGYVYRQEFLPNEAEDVAKILDTNATVTIAEGTFTGCLQTEDWTPIDPKAREHKFYKPGIGLLLEINLTTGARTELVQIINP